MVFKYVLSTFKVFLWYSKYICKLFFLYSEDFLEVFFFYKNLNTSVYKYLLENNLSFKKLS